jgi:hypothetical protein
MSSVVIFLTLALSLYRCNQVRSLLRRGLFLPAKSRQEVLN